MATKNPTIKTTVTFSPDFLRRLKSSAQAKKRSVSRFIEEELAQKLKSSEKQEINEVYKKLMKLKGMAKSKDTTVSKSIDDILYGENGAWRGQHHEE